MKEVTRNNKRRATVELQSSTAKKVRIQCWEPHDEVVYSAHKYIYFLFVDIYNNWNF